MTSQSNYFNPKIKYITHVHSISKEEYTKLINDIIQALYIESRHAAILLNKLAPFNDRIIIINKDPSIYVSTTCIYPKIIYPERNHGYGDNIIIVIPPSYEGFVDSVEPLIDYNNSNEENKSLIHQLHNYIPLQKIIDSNTLNKFKIIKRPQYCKIYFAHELLHAYHYFYNTFNENTNNLQEHVIIYGLEGYTIVHNNKEIYITENIIRGDYGYYPRISHNFEKSL